MSKHSTHSPDRIAKLLDGNWNRHKKRPIDSRLRTVGRRKRYMLRHPSALHDYQEHMMKAVRDATGIPIWMLRGQGKGDIL